MRLRSALGVRRLRVEERAAVKKQDIKQLQEDVFKRCGLGCDEMHAHSATQGCISGSATDVQTLVLCEHALRLHSKVRKAAEELD